MTTYYEDPALGLASAPTSSIHNRNAITQLLNNSQTEATLHFENTAEITSVLEQLNDVMNSGERFVMRIQNTNGATDASDTYRTISKYNSLDVQSSLDREITIDNLESDDATMWLDINLKTVTITRPEKTSLVSVGADPLPCGSTQHARRLV
jgi:hypothetical protein